MTESFERLKQKYLYPAREKPKKKEKQPRKKIKSEHQIYDPAEIIPTKDIQPSQPKKINDYRFGSHISIQKGYTSAAEYAKKSGFNCFQIFTQSPRSTKFRPFDDEEGTRCKQYIKENDLEMWIHCSHAINYCRKCCPSTQYLRDSVVEDMRRAIKMGAKGCVINVGKLNSKEGIISKTGSMYNFKHNIEKTIETLIDEGAGQLPWLLIQTASGQGTETPVSIEGLSELYFSINEAYRKYIGFCVDTCHIFASGECNIKNTDDTNAFINRWKEHIGGEHVKLIHYNDSKSEFGSCEGGGGCVPIGKGMIGTRALTYFRDFCILTGKSMVTEW